MWKFSQIHVLQCQGYYIQIHPELVIIDKIQVVDENIFSLILFLADHNLMSVLWIIDLANEGKAEVKSWLFALNLENADCP